MDKISIPSGAIKSLDNAIFGKKRRKFQFLLVRLRGTQKKTTAA